MEDQIVGHEVLEGQRNLAVGGSSVLMKKLPRILPGLGNGKKAVSHVLTF